MRVKRRMIEQLMLGLLLGVLMLRFWLLSGSVPGSASSRESPGAEAVKAQNRVKARAQKEKAMALNPFQKAQLAKEGAKLKRKAVHKASAGVVKAAQMGSFSATRIHTQGSSAVTRLSAGVQETEDTDENPIPMAFRKERKRVADGEYDPFADEEESEGGGEAGIAEGSMEEGEGAEESGAGEGGETDDGSVVKLLDPTKVTGELPDEIVENIERDRANDEMSAVLTEDGFDNEVDEEGWSEEEIARQAKLAEARARLAKLKEAEDRWGQDVKAVDRMQGQWGRVESGKVSGKARKGRGGGHQREDEEEEGETVDVLAANLKVVAVGGRVEKEVPFDIGKMNSDWDSSGKKKAKLRGGFQGSLKDYDAARAAAAEGNGVAGAINGVMAAAAVAKAPATPPPARRRRKPAPKKKLPSFLDTVDPGTDELGEESITEDPGLQMDLEAALGERGLDLDLGGGGGGGAGGGGRREDAPWLDEDEAEADEQPATERPRVKMRVRPVGEEVSMEVHSTNAEAGGEDFISRLKKVRVQVQQPKGGAGVLYESGLEKARELEDDDSQG